VLSIGCGWGATEAALKQRGVDVTALPLDSVIGAVAAKRGVAPVYGRLDECLTKLGGETFDCVLITRLLHLQRTPRLLFNSSATLVRKGGFIVIDSPNFSRLSILAKRLLRYPEYRHIRRFSDSGVSTVGPAMLVQAANKAGFSSATIHWYDHSLPKTIGVRHLPLHLGRFTAGGWVFRAIRKAAR
jgi:hypothetical protein